MIWATYLIAREETKWRDGGEWSDIREFPRLFEMLLLQAVCTQKKNRNSYPNGI